MQNCNEDIIFYVPVNSKLQHSPAGISHLNFPHPPFKHMLKCPILGSYKVIKRPFSLSIVKKKCAYWARFFRALSLQRQCLTNEHDFSLTSTCVSISAISATILIRVPLNFTQIHIRPSHTRLSSPPQFWATLSNLRPLRHTQVCQMPQVCPVKVLMFLLDRYITHQELYTVLDQNQNSTGGRRACVSEDIWEQFALIVLVPLEQ